MRYWTQEKEKLLVELLVKFDSDFKKIQKYFPEKTIGALVKKTQRMDPEVKSGKWDTEEDIKLVL